MPEKRATIQKSKVVFLCSDFFLNDHIAKSETDKIAKSKTDKIGKSETH